MNTSSPPFTDPGAMVGRMVPFAIDSLPALRLPSGLYCFDVQHADRSALRGSSVRYSLMVLLGLQRAQQADYAVVDLDASWATCLDHRGDFAPGDYGLAMWADQRRGGAAASDLVRWLGSAIPRDSSLVPLVGMEIGWLVIGLAEAVVADVPGADVLLRRVTAELESRRARSGLYRHHGGSGVRRRLPNFATEIYSVLALATLARHGLDESATDRATVLADRLLGLQLPDGGWPWLFDAERGSVVETYEVYSVHQDAMAPMALIELTDVTGDQRYLDAAVAGLAWSHGANELSVDLFDENHGFAHRSIRRKRPWDRVALALDSAASVAMGVRPVRSSPVELNRTCRPYHLGWILEAWAGREKLACPPERAA